jgi:hypothetical protein
MKQGGMYLEFIQSFDFKASKENQNVYKFKQ